MNETPLWVWITFGISLLMLLGIDLFAHRDDREQSHRAAVIWSVIWIGAGLLFAGFVWQVEGWREAQEYLAAYLIEKSLSLDNLFVFLIVFGILGIPHENQRTALSWGIFGALVFRAIFIFVGVATLERWAWVEYVFAAILLVAAWQTLRKDPADEHENRAVEWLSKKLNVSRNSAANTFFTMENGKRKVTPLLVAVLAIEMTDVVFAIDSVPAALAVSRNEFVVYSSNAFAILGLRSLYMVLERSLTQLHHLHYGLAAVLAFAALKMMFSHWIHIPPMISVLIILLCIGAATWSSLRNRPREAPRGPHEEDRLPT